MVVSCSVKESGIGSLGSDEVDFFAPNDSIVVGLLMEKCINLELKSGV